MRCPFRPNAMIITSRKCREVIVTECAAARWPAWT
jgi:hypothetical protein